LGYTEDTSIALQLQVHREPATCPANLVFQDYQRTPEFRDLRQEKLPNHSLAFVLDWPALEHWQVPNSEEILACAKPGITVTLAKPMSSNSKAEGRFKRGPR
jgi:hypothetical protein